MTFTLEYNNFVIKYRGMTTIQVNERTKAGKVLVETARMMADKYKGISVVQDSDTDDPELLKKMLAARKSGVIDREKVLDTLNVILEK